MYYVHQEFLGYVRANASYVPYANASYVSHMSYHDFDTSYVLMRNKFGRVVTLYVGPLCGCQNVLSLT
jgi:hypothetical protein